MPSYWIDVFTADTWIEASAHHFTASGFRIAREGFARKVIPGDIFICYLGGGISRWVGALEVISGPFITDKPRIWKSDPFPVRFQTKPIVALDPETAIPVPELSSSLEMFRRLKHPQSYGYMFQGSPMRFKYQADGAAVLEALRKAAAHPMIRPISVKEPRRMRKEVAKPPSVINDRPTATAETVPEREIVSPADERAHSEIQYALLKLGSDLGLDVWVARNDRNRSWNGLRFQDVKRMRQQLPEQFDPLTQRIVELIDVLWIEREGIRCAFEVENSTNIYGGVLRMSDLVARRPNIELPLYIVAPDERYAKVVQELNRPTFAHMQEPLVEVCKFIPYGALRKSLQRWSEDIGYLKPDVIDRIAVSCRKA